MLLMTFRLKGDCTGPGSTPGPVRPGESAADLNSARHCFRLFRNRDRQHAVAARGVHLLAIDGIGQDKSTVKLAMTSLHSSPLGLVAPFAARLPAFARQGQ